MSYIESSTEDFLLLGKKNAAIYQSAKPFPNIYFDDFFVHKELNEVLDEFPDLSKTSNAIAYNDNNQIKLASKGEYKFGDKTRKFVHFLNSQPFLEFLTNLTGIEALIPDPYFEGGGFHEIKPGGLLKIHADFNKHKITNLDRRLNVLIYLNKDWEESYGGNFELWDSEMKGCEKKILPLFNRMAIFTTTDFSFHGHPDPLKCPEDRSRKSLALYYYTNGRPDYEINPGLEKHSTLFKSRPKVDKQTMSLKNIIREITPPFIYDSIKRIKS